MKTDGYDLVVEMGENFPNKLALAYYYMGRFPKLQGTYVLPLRKVPPNLAPLTVIDYDVKLGVPSVDFIGRNTVRLSISAEALLTVLGINLKFAVGFTVDAAVFYDEASAHLLVDLRSPKVSAKINDERVSQKALDALNNILAIVLREYLARDVPFIDLSPFVSYSLAVPGSKVPFSLSFGNFKITDDFLAVGIKALERSGGNIAKVEDFADGNDLAIGISEDGMHRFFDFWWDNGSVVKRIESRGECDTDVPWQAELFVDTYIKIVGEFSWIASLIAAATKLERVGLRYETAFDLAKPRFDLLRGNKIKINGEADFHFMVKAVLYYKVYNPAKFKWKHLTAIIASWTDDVHITYQATATLSLDSQGNLSAKLGSLTLSLRGLPKLIEAFVDTFAGVVASKMLEKHPPLLLGSIPVARQIPGTKLTLEITPSLNTTDEEAYVRAGVRIRGLENYPPSPYIANRSPKALEVHVPECEWLHLITARHRVPYYSLEEAHTDGYDNCHYCIGGSLR